MFVSPYNVIHYVFAEKKVESVLAAPAVRSEGMGGDYSDIKDVKYLGTHHYYVETEESHYIIMLKTKKDAFEVIVYEYQMNIKKLPGYRG